MFKIPNLSIYGTKEVGDINTGIKVNPDDLEEERIIEDLYDEIRKFAKYVKKISQGIKEGKMVIKDKISVIYDTIKFIEGKLARVCNSSTPYITNIVYGIVTKVGKLPVFTGVWKELPI